MFKSPINKQGFTLIEATIAIAVLVVGIWSIMNFFPFGVRIIGDAQHTTTATSIALSQIEVIQAQDYDTVSTGTIETKEAISSDPASYLHGYQRETIVELIDSNFDVTETDVGLKRITVIVYWQSTIGSVEKSIQIQSVVSDR